MEIFSTIGLRFVQRIVVVIIYLSGIRQPIEASQHLHEEDMSDRVTPEPNEEMTDNVTPEPDEEMTDNVTPVPDSQAKCPQCGKKNKNLKAHIQAVHDQVKRYECSYCGLKSYYGNVITRHIKTHPEALGAKLVEIANKTLLVTPVPDFLTKCPQCDKEIRRGNLNVHIRSVHDQVKRYECDYCGFRNYYKNKMIRHINKTHLGASGDEFFKIDNTNVVDKVTPMPNSLTKCPLCNEKLWPHNIERHNEENHRQGKRLAPDELGKDLNTVHNALKHGNTRERDAKRRKLEQQKNDGLSPSESSAAICPREMINPEVVITPEEEHASRHPIRHHHAHGIRPVNPMSALAAVDRGESGSDETADGFQPGGNVIKDATNSMRDEAASSEDKTESGDEGMDCQDQSQEKTGEDVTNNMRDEADFSDESMEIEDEVFRD